MNKWEMFKMPQNMTGISFLDIGCWEGDNCAEAVNKNSKKVVGIDLCTCDSLVKNIHQNAFTFLQTDIFSEKFLEIGRFDIVLCSGVLYHVENVFSLLFRLRTVVSKLLVLETAITVKHQDDLVLLLADDDDPSNDPSLWWRPNKKCLMKMLEIAGFGNFKIIFETPTGKKDISRICLHATPVTRDIPVKIAPRRDAFMSIKGGERS